MARAIAKCKCLTCGEEFEKINRNCYNRSAANDWEHWAETHYTTCPDCYQKEQEEKKKTDPFEFQFFMEIRSKGVTYGYKVISNNSYQRKEDLKGYGFTFNNGSWEITFTAKSFEQMIEEGRTEYEKLKAAFPGSEAKGIIPEKRARKMFEDAERISVALDELGPCPDYPKEFADMISGKKWNGKIYGGNSKSVYLDGEKVELSDDLAKDIENAKLARSAWKTEREFILSENQYPF